MRKVILAEDEYYHVFNRSIAGFIIYNGDYDFRRFLDVVEYYQKPKRIINFAKFMQYTLLARKKINENKIDEGKLVDIICYCLMPTHFHLLLKQNTENGITKFLQLIENSYSRYFNIAHKRKGPLWEGRFKSVHIDNDEQLLHLTRYIHLNPTSAGLVKNPEEWKYSSYKEYLKKEEICNFRKIIDLDQKEYKKFVNDRKNYQKELSILKSQLIDHYAG